MEGNSNDGHDDAPAIWTESPFSSSPVLYQGLQTMEELMQCTLCDQLMTHPVSVQPCHHSFCRQCWEDYDHRQQKQQDDDNKVDESVSCPTCQEDVATNNNNEPLVLPNLTLDKLIQTYQTLRAPLKASLMTAAAEAVQKNVGGTKEAKPTTTEKPKAKLGTSGQKRGRRENEAELDEEPTMSQDETSKQEDNNVQPSCDEVLQPIVNSQPSPANNHHTKKGAKTKTKKQAAIPRASRQKTADSESLPSFAGATLTTTTTPVAPTLFQPGSNAPSTIPHALSQPAIDANDDDALDKIAQAGALASSPTHRNVTNEADMKTGTASKKAASKPPKLKPKPTKRASQKRIAAPKATKSRRTKASETKDPAHTEEPTATASAKSTGRRGGRSGKGPWTCGICTFANTKNVWSTAHCEMCQTSRTVAEAN